MAKPQVSFAKRQREQQKKERRENKAAKRSERRSTGETESEFEPMVAETPIDDKDITR
ncbi:MAG TPA: hypothetical protein VEK11_20750 [Thermoanaerobaculia bacterium]|nr:hypothetical protein [Thermoanaerobaculia bacterium]